MDLVDIGDGHRLAPAPAASYLRMRAAGCPAGITSSYRSSAYQAYLRAEYLAGRGAFALPAGSSQHERGYALDLHWAAAQWVRAHPEHGWRFTNPDEWWHVDYVLVLDVAATQVTPLDPLEDDMPTADEIAAAVWTYQNPSLAREDAYSLLRRSTNTSTWGYRNANLSDADAYAILRSIQAQVLALRAAGAQASPADIAHALAPLLTPAITTALGERAGISAEDVEAAAERAVREVLGSLDE